MKGWWRRGFARRKGEKEKEVIEEHQEEDQRKLWGDRGEKGGGVGGVGGVVGGRAVTRLWPDQLPDTADSCCVESNVFSSPPSPIFLPNSSSPPNTPLPPHLHLIVIASSKAFQNTLSLKHAIPCILTLSYSALLFARIKLLPFWILDLCAMLSCHRSHNYCSVTSCLNFLNQQLCFFFAHQGESEGEKREKEEKEQCLQIMIEAIFILGAFAFCSAVLCCTAWLITTLHCTTVQCTL